MKGVPIDYFLDGELFAFRRRDYVPATRDHFRFNGIYYRVDTVDWIEDQGDDLKVEIRMTKAPGQ
ncbi:MULTISPECIES: hypothetical protein [unclassified Pseudomonas]|uniref:hypothetical protein n=1 Tax=Pseudomonas sp. RTB2 TaxID=3048632 RepID=UPI002B221BF1|nr:MULTISPECIES: hypothetical protein [unclassified Pseudomonas]MEB0008644.1 hypothetical protein [Pseudomonas sp. RTB2]MEB0270866.1 hypothetical protein [Pseudomonas sp. 5B4]